MPESETHMKLVQAIFNRIDTHYNGNECIKLFDSQKTNADKRPPTIGGFVPDVYAKKIKNNDYLILGEAKTTRDIDTHHSEQQIKAFIKHCSRIKESCFILAVPWDNVIYAKDLIKEFKKELQIDPLKFEVINEFGF